MSSPTYVPPSTINTINYNPSGLPVSGDGTCGPENGDASCWESGFGNCCKCLQLRHFSRAGLRISGAAGGFCGDDINYCGSGCLSAYGSCTSSAAIPTQTSTDGTCGFEDGIVVICNGTTYGNCCKVPFFPVPLLHTNTEQAARLAIAVPMPLPAISPPAASRIMAYATTPRQLRSLLHQQLQRPSIRIPSNLPPRQCLYLMLHPPQWPAPHHTLRLR